MILFENAVNNANEPSNEARRDVGTRRFALIVFSFSLSESCQRELHPCHRDGDRYL